MEGTVSRASIRAVLLPAVGLGALLAAFAMLGYASPIGTAAQLQYAPSNTTPPSIGGTAQAGQTLTANPGAWAGDQPMVFTFQWQRCNPAGQNCVPIPDATGQTYAVVAADVGNTLRVAVTAQNATGSSTATSAPTARVVEAGEPPPPPGPPGQIRLPNGQISIPVTSVDPPHRLIASEVRFNPRPLRSRTAPFEIRVRVRDTRGFVVRDALVFVRSTPLVTTAPAERPTGQDGWATLQSTPRPDFRLVFRRGYNLVHFVRVRKPNDSPLAGVSGRRLVQVPISP